MEANELAKKRFEELAKRAYQNNVYTFTGFLGLSEMADFYEVEKELSYIPCRIFGGSEACERVMIRFGSEALFGYEEEFPITCMKVEPLAKKFADDLGHRDFLGALMNLGIERSTLGDITVRENEGIIYCTRTIAPFIKDNLNKVSHTPVKCAETTVITDGNEQEPEEIRIQISSERIDGIIAKVYKMSRNDSLELFRQKKIFVNGRQCENNSQSVKENDSVTVRGYGKFIYKGNDHYSKKGKINAAVVYYGNR